MQFVGDAVYSAAAQASLRSFLPPYPDTSAVSSVRIPPPPVLREEHDSATRLELLIRAYRTVIQAITGQRCAVLARRGSVQRYKHAGELRDFAELLTQKTIAPLAWAHWRVSYWYRQNARRKFPPVRWVYALDALQRLRWMFRQQYGELSTGAREFLVPAHRELLERWSAAETALYKTGSEQEAREVAATYFPPGEYERLLELGQAQAITEQANIERRVRRGEWLWEVSNA